MSNLIQMARDVNGYTKGKCRPATNIISIINDQPRLQKDKRLMVPISHEELEAAHSFASSLGVSTSYLVRQLLKTAIESQCEVGYGR
ncbi:hypothetical protein [Nostoc punctiforme]|uniref:hypothetical protein n=1 Tax=Nostoc punctiforme TaxID=272131 RepID=UPI000045C153|nr:hypothetical protein [Nostoc punctiforme]